MNPAAIFLVAADEKLKEQEETIRLLEEEKGLWRTRLENREVQLAASKELIFQLREKLKLYKEIDLKKA